MKKKRTDPLEMAQDKLDAANRHWDHIYSSSLSDRVEREFIANAMNLLNIAERNYQFERSALRERQIAKIPVDENSPENIAMENFRQLGLRILREIRGD